MRIKISHLLFPPGFPDAAATAGAPSSGSVSGSVSYVFTAPASISMTTPKESASAPLA